jgi:hypothetical protein
MTMLVDTPRPTGEPVQRLTEVAYRAGVHAGHQDGIAHLRLLIHEARVAGRSARRGADRFSYEDPARATFNALAHLHRSHVRDLSRAARALKEGAHR